MINRERKVNVENMDNEQIRVVEDQISAKLRVIIDNACEEANKLLNIYGLEAKMQFSLDKKESNQS